MMKALLSARFQALLAGLTAQGRIKKKKSTGTIALFIFLYLYVLVVAVGMMCWLTHSLAVTYHAIGLDWLYFSIIGTMALALSVIGTVFTTQNQLYDAKDNQLLLSMPIKPGMILLSRMIPLLAMNLLFTCVVMVPASVMYAIVAGFSLAGLLCQLAATVAICLLAQGIACLLGWLLHLLLARMNKSAASMVFMVVFLGIYFTVYSQASEILQSIAMNAQQIADAMQSWVWPLYAMGIGSLGNLLYLLAFIAIAAGVFGLVYFFLSATFLRTATRSGSARKRKKLDVSRSGISSPANAVVQKELRKFLSSPVYLTNMGLGVIMTAILPVAGLIFKDRIVPILALLDPSGDYLPAVICGILAFSASMCCISTPSVSLEGKNLWILRAAPISSRSILLAKLRFHCLMTVPVIAISGLVLSIAYGCGAMGILLSVLIPCLLAVFTGLLGLWAGLMWAKLDYINEAYPCKQSVSVVVAMFVPWGMVILLGLAYIPLSKLMGITVYLFICAFLLLAFCAFLFRVVTGWGVKKWESLQA